MLEKQPPTTAEREDGEGNPGGNQIAIPPNHGISYVPAHVGWKVHVQCACVCRWGCGGAHGLGRFGREGD